MSQSRSFSTAAAAALLFAATSLANASPGVPFNGSFVGEANETLVGTYVLAQVHGTGQITGLGRATVSALYLLDTTTLAFAGGAVFTGASGSVTAKFKGQFVPLANGFFGFSAPLTILGGTGAYQGATGSGTFSGVSDSKVTPETFVADVAATIFRKSGKKNN